jgi:hypothetical protein
LDPADQGFFVLLLPLGLEHLELVGPLQFGQAQFSAATLGICSVGAKNGCDAIRSCRDTYRQRLFRQRHEHKDPAAVPR